MTASIRNKKIKDKRPEAKHSWSFVEIMALTTAGLAILAVVLFFIQPLSIQSGQDSCSRGFFVLFPLLSPELFWGLMNSYSDHIAVFDCRVIVLCWKWTVLLAVMAVGYFLLDMLKIHSILNQSERLFFSLVCGLALWSLFFFILAWSGGIRWIIAPKIMTVVMALLGLYYLRQEQKQMSKKSDSTIQRHRMALFLLLLLPFVLLYSFGSLLPTFEYDMLEYHLQGPREILESGRLSFFHHNVYLNMPLGTEMFYLWGSLLYGSGMESALVGKAIVNAVSLITALGIYSFVLRWFRSYSACLIAVLVYLSFIWNYQVFSIGLNDGVLGMTIFATFYAMTFLVRKSATTKAVLLSGLCTGFAIAIKYTAVVFLLLPVLCVLFILLIRRYLVRMEKKSIRSCLRAMTPLACFLLTVCIIGGGWYLKNSIITGNPVYPLAWNVFGDSTGSWSEEINRRWQRAHSPDQQSIASFGRHINDVVFRDIGASPFIILFCVFVPGASLFFLKHFKMIPTHLRQWIWFGMIGYVFLFLLLWGFCTHRLIRFLVPVLPFIAVLLSGALALYERKVFNKDNRNLAIFLKWIRTGVIVVLFFCGWYSFFLSMLNQRDYMVAPARIVLDSTRFSDWAVWFNSHSDALGENEKLLLIGDANAFAFQVPVLYSTCWDHSPLMKYMKDTVKKSDNGIIAIIQKKILKKNLTNAGIKYILVNEGELERFCSSGNYGFTDSEINGTLFTLLVESDILQPFYPPEWSAFSDQAKEKIQVYQVQP